MARSTKHLIRLQFGPKEEQYITVALATAVNEIVRVVFPKKVQHVDVWVSPDGRLPKA